MKRVLTILCVATLFMSACQREMGYVPIAAFEPSYKALQGADENHYDIEETVRILNGMEAAQSSSENFDAFLEYMARQDYSKVAQDVVDLRLSLLPVLQEMYLIEHEYEQVNMWSSLIRDLSMDLSQQVEGSLTSSDESLSHGLLSFLGMTNMLPGQIVLTSLVKTGSEVFESYEKSQKLKDELKLRMSNVKKQYLSYLEDYIPIYNKYMQEWNELCLIKDRAYLQIYSGQYQSALQTCEEALAIDPQNREMRLLQALSVIQTSEVSTHSTPLSAPTMGIEQGITTDGVVAEELQYADKLLNQYISDYPTYSAPALLLKGMIHLKSGNKAQAIVYLDQSAMEYPRQAKHLTDMLSSYRARTYLNNTAEGAYLLSLYQSTMEGFGLFSPNFAKAKIHELNGDYLSVQEEIYNHFFRRSNQTIYDCLLLDMEYCEKHFASCFKQLLPENSYLDVRFTRSAKVMGMGNDNQKLMVTLSNRSDKIFENIRIFLCMHYTDMYKTDYHVMRAPTLNRIQGNESATLGEVEINYRNKSFNDITRARAIALTDNTLCWIDNVYNAETGVNYNPTRSASIGELAGSMNMNQRQHYFASMNESANSIYEALNKNTSIEIIESSNLLKHHTELHIRLPRIVMMLNPIYLLNNEIVPTENYLQGSIAHLVFKDAKLSTENQLTIKSPYASYTLDFKENEGKYSVTKIETLIEN